MNDRLGFERDLMLDKPRPHKSVRESEIERYLVRRVEQLGGITYKINAGLRAGAPDRIVMLPGVGTMFVEVKAPGKTPRPRQSREHQRLKAMGYTVTIVDCFAMADLVCAWGKQLP